MPFTIEKRPDNGFITVFEGAITPQDSEEARKAVTGGDLSNYAAIPYILVDYSAATGILHTSDDIRKLATSFNLRVRQHNPEIFIAIVAPKDLVFGMARMFHSYAGGDERVIMVRDRKDAEVWLKEVVGTKM